MLKDNVQEALNKQLNAEMYSSNLYLSMAAYFESINLPGFAGWLKVQAKEELGHAMKIYGFINERLGRVAIGAVAAPPAEWDSPLAAFQAVLEHERKVTGMVDDLVKVACDADDSATAIFLQWFVTEQVEEEASADLVVERLKMVGEAAGPLFMFDSVMGKREG